jgi:hypothetical protein
VPIIVRVAAAACALVAVAAVAGGTALAGTLGSGAALCSSSFVSAVISGDPNCLRAGEFCSVGNVDYHCYGFDCSASGHLVSYRGPSMPATAKARATSPPASPDVGRTVLIAPRTRASGCARGTSPDERCSPGAYYSLLSRAVICSPSFRTAAIRDVPQSEKFQVERDYGMPASYYGRSIEIDHIVSLELGGSNDIANLYPEPGSGDANYHGKDTLENKLHDLVCAGAITLRAAQRQIARNWRALYERVFGVAP